MSKIQQYQRDVYQAISEMEQADITIDNIVDFVRWDNCRETRTHYVRDAVQVLKSVGVVSVHRLEDGKTLVINKTAQFDKSRVRNPWI